MHVLVTGATGFVGQHLCNELLKSGVRVTGLTRMTNSREFFKSNNITDSKDFQIVNCDITQEKDLIETVKKLQPIDCVLHLAGQTYKKQSLGPQFYFQTNFIGTLNILECCRIFNIRRLIFSSTIAVYGLSAGQFQPKYLPVDELHETLPYDFYDVSKYNAEQLCRFYFDRFGISIIVLRYSRIYGPGMKGGLIFTAISNALSNSDIQVFGDISTDFVFVKDVVNANLAALENPMEGFEIFNIGSGQETTLYDICSKIIELAKSSSKIGFHPENKSKFSLDISKAKKILIYNPISLEQGLIESINYIKNSKK